MSQNDGKLPTTRGRPSLKRKCKNSEDTLSMNSTKLSKTKPSTILEENKTVQQITLLTDLPNEVIGKIFENVSLKDLFNLEQTNKKIFAITKNLVWPKKNTLNTEAVENPNISEFEREIIRISKLPKIKRNSMKAIFSRTNIQHLDLSDYHKKIKFRVCLLLPKTPQLLTLNLSNIKLNENDLLKIAQHCPLLEELSLKGSFENEDFDDVLKQIFIKCSNIKYLDLEGNRKMFGASFVHIPSQLKYLNIYECYNLTLQALNNLVIRAQNLETLIWSNFFYAGNPMNLLSQFKKLRFLELLDTKKIFMDFSKIKELEMLSLTLYRSVNVESLQTLQNCPNLKSLKLHFRSCPMINVYEILQNCISLEYFDITEDTNLNQLLNFVQHRKLKYLSLSDCGDISAEIIKTLLTECENLTHLEFDCLCNLNYEAISNALKEECPKRKNILKLAIEKPPFKLLKCKWCRIIKNGYLQKFRHFTDVKLQYKKYKSLC